MKKNAGRILRVIAAVVGIAVVVMFILKFLLPYDVLIEYRISGGMLSSSKTRYKYIYSPLKVTRDASSTDEIFNSETFPTDEELAELMASDSIDSQYYDFAKIGNTIYYMKMGTSTEFHKFSLVDKSITKVPLSSINERLMDYDLYGWPIINPDNVSNFGVLDLFPGMDDVIVEYYDKVDHNFIIGASVDTAGGRAFFKIGHGLYEYLPETRSARHLGDFTDSFHVVWAKPK